MTTYRWNGNVYGSTNGRWCRNRCGGTHEVADGDSILLSFTRMFHTMPEELRPLDVVVRDQNDQPVLLTGANVFHRMLFDGKYLDVGEARTHDKKE